MRRRDVREIKFTYTTSQRNKRSEPLIRKGFRPFLFYHIGTESAINSTVYKEEAEQVLAIQVEGTNQ